MARDLFEEAGITPDGGRDLFAEAGIVVDEAEQSAPEGIGGLLKNVWTGTKQTGRMVGAAGNTLSGDLADVEGYAESANAARATETPLEQRRLQAEIQAIDRNQGTAGQVGDTLAAAARNPMGTAQMTAEQLPNTAVVLGGGWAGAKAGALAGGAVGSMIPVVGTAVGAGVGGALGFLGGMFLGNSIIETGSKAMEKSEGGFTEAERGEAIREGAVKGGVITAVDAATLKLGGMAAKTLGGAATKAGARAEVEVLMKAGVDMSSPATINAALAANKTLYETAKAAGEAAAKTTMSMGQKAAIHGTGLTMETASEGVGEYLGELAATGKGDAIDATIEALSAFSQSAIETSYNYQQAAKPEISGHDIYTASQVAKPSHDPIETIPQANTADEAIAAFEAATAPDLALEATDLLDEEPATEVSPLAARILAGKDDAGLAAIVADERSTSYLRRVAGEELARRQQGATNAGLDANPNVVTPGAGEQASDLERSAGVDVLGQPAGLERDAGPALGSVGQASPAGMAGSEVGTLNAAQPEQVAQEASQTQSKESQAITADVPSAQTVTAQGAASRSDSSLNRDSSWVIKNKETGEVIMETFDRKKVDALNTAKYEAVPIVQHLASLNQSSIAQTPAIQSETGLPKTADTVNLESGANLKQTGDVLKSSTNLPKSSTPTLSIGTTPANAEPITVREGVIYQGDYPAQHFETGEPITVPEGANRFAIAKALRDGGVLSNKQKIYGLNETQQAKAADIPQQATTKAVPAQEQIAQPKGQQSPSNSLIQRIKQLGGINNVYVKDVTGEGKNRVVGLFRKPEKDNSGSVKAGHGLDTLARILASEGFDIDVNEVDGGVGKLSELVQEALTGRSVLNLAAQEEQNRIDAEARHREELKAEIAKRGGQLPKNITTAKLEKLYNELTEAERALAAEVEEPGELSLAAEIADSDMELDIPFDGPGNVTQAEAMRSLGFTEDEINEYETQEDSRQTGETDARGQSQGVEARQDQAAQKVDTARTGRAGLERRTDTARRQRVAEMDAETLRRELLTDELTGLGNRRAYNESAKLPAQVAIDADSLKWINDNFGHEAGDKLLVAIGEALGAETGNAYHISGDEYVVQAESLEEARAVMDRAVERLNNARMAFADREGNPIILNGIGISYGIAGDLNEAENLAAAHKTEREQQGKRAARGAVPPNAVRGDRGGETGGDNATDAEKVATQPQNVSAKAESGDTASSPTPQEVNPESTKPAESKPASEMTASELLRAAADKMDAEKTQAVDNKPAEVDKAEQAEKGKAEDLFGEKANTEDSGAELTYNKRNRIKTGLKWADIENKDAALRVKETTKPKVYAKPDYQAMIDDGMEPFVAHIVKQAYDSISAKPSTRGAPSDAELQMYIDGVNRYMDGVMAWANDPKLVAAWVKKIGSRASAMLGASRGTPTNLSDLGGAPEKSMLDMVYPDGWREYRDEIRLIGSNKALGGLQPNTDEAIKAMKEIEKGWPTPQEAWQKQGYQVIDGNEIKPSYYEGTHYDKGTHYVAVTFKHGGRDVKTVFVEDAKTKDAPAVQEAVNSMMAEVKDQFALVNKRYRIVGVHPTEEAAIEAARQATKREGKQPVKDVGIKVTQAERIGEARREPGENIDSDTLKETFGFKGVNFGTWMKGDANQEERQLHLNHAYDSMLDLAEILGVPPKAMSLNGMLGLAIGAQGSGGFAAAHFVPGVNEINLTRTSGAGSLAHEFGHAVDHYFARQAGLERNSDPFLTVYQRSAPGSEIRPEIIERFKSIVTAMNKRPITPEEAAKQTEDAGNRAKMTLNSWLKSVESNTGLKEDPEFQKIIERIRAGNLGDGKIKLGQRTYVSPAVADLAAYIKKTKGRAYPTDQLRGLESAAHFAGYIKSEKVATKDHVPQMVRSNYSIEAGKLDSEKGGKAYWNTEYEKFARAFDAFVSDTLEAKAAKNTYLSHAGRLDETTPQGEERTRINQALKDLIADIQTKETDTGLALYSRASGIKFAEFAKLGDKAVDAETAFADAERITGLELGLTLKANSELSEDVPARFLLSSRTIEYNPNIQLGRAQMAQHLAEEILHALDSLNFNRTLSAGSKRLDPRIGDIALEAIQHFDDGGVYKQFLKYPLGDEKLADDVVKAELFARLGVLYFGNPDGMRQALPLAYGAFDGIFKIRVNPVTGEVSRSIRGIARRAGETRRQPGGVRPDARRDEESTGNGRTPELGRLRDAVSKAFDADRLGKRVNFGRLNSRRQSEIDGVTAPQEIARTEVVGDSGRNYTPEQRAAMGRTGSTKIIRTPKEVVKSLWAGSGKRMAQGFFDQFRPVRDVSDYAYTLMRLSKGATGAFEAFMHHGKLSLRDGAFDADTSGGVLETVFYPLGKESTDFLRWIAGNRAERLMKEGKENLFTKEDIAAFKSLAEGKTDFDYTMPDGSKTRDRTAIYKDSLKKFNEFNRNVLDMAEMSGLIDGASRSLWEHEFYVPFYRAADEEGGVRGMNIKSGVIRQQAFKKLKGGEQVLNDLLENTLMNWAHLIDASAKNRAAEATIIAAEKLGVTRKATEHDKNKVWFMDNGKKAEYVIEDPYLLEAVSALEYSGLRSPVMDAMSTMKHVLTVGVTASPFFKVRNLIRDSVQAIATASDSDLSYNPVGNVVKGFKLTNRASQEYVSALAGGGLIRFGTMLEGSEAKRTRQLIKQGAKDSHILDNESKVRAFYDKVIEPTIAAYNELGNRGEEINRMALYDALIKQGIDHATASLMARDLMDFSMQGTFASVRFLTQVVPFMNARLQGMYKLGRAGKSDPARFAAVLGMVSLASLALLAAYGDDDDWKEREDWDRDNYWWFKIGGIAYRIPKPFEIGAIATLTERSAELLFDSEMTGERFAKVTSKLVMDQLAMNPVPQLFKPVIDLYANHDSFTGREIETMGMENVDPQYRYRSSTSMVARGVSTAGNVVTGDNFLSPVQVDHVVRSYFGWLGSFSVGMADTMIRGVSNEPGRPAPDYWKTATGGMVADLDGARSRYVTQMYDQANEIEQAYGTWRNLIKQGKREEAEEYREDNKEELKRYNRVKFIKAQVSNLNKRIQQIERSDLDSEEKRDRINALRARQSEIAQRLTAD